MPTTPMDRDEEKLELVKELVLDPTLLNRMSDDEWLSLIESCERNLNQITMGGRSHSLTLLSVILWNAVYRSTLVEDLSGQIETFAVLGIRVAVDKSFIQPEWAIVLVGVILARWKKDLERALGQDNCERFYNTIIAILKDYKDNHENSTVKRAAELLLRESNRGFTNGLRDVVTGMLKRWPASDVARSFDKKQLDKIEYELMTLISSKISDDHRSLYRMKLEDQGFWGAIEAVGPILT